MLSCIEKSDLVYDVGANVGDATQLFLSYGARVIAFEPQPNCVAVLDERFKKEISEGLVTVYPVGLSDVAKWMTLSVCSISPTVSTFSAEWKQGRFKGFVWDKHIEVRVKRLAEIFNVIGLPKYIKINTEGWEFPVLKGMGGECPAFLSFEHAHECISKTRLCIDVLVGKEFNFFYHDTYRLSLKRWVSAHEINAYLESQTDPMFWGNVCVRNVLCPR